MTLASCELIGNAAEFLVCYDLAKRGYRTALSPYPKSPYDVICEVNKSFLRVQVKGTSRPVARKTTQAKYYQFNIPDLEHRDFDILALVATDLETIHYLDFNGFKDSKSTIVIPAAQMHKNKDVQLMECMKNFG